LVLATTGFLKGGGFKEGHHFLLLCVDLHTISHAPFLADMKHGLQFARAGGHKRKIINVQEPTHPDLRCSRVV